MSVWDYFNSPTKLAFHDLTDGDELPVATHTVLGLSNKFVPVPNVPTTRKSAMESFEQFQRNLSWKVLFAEEDPDFVKSKLYLKSNKIPPLPPLRIDRRLCKVEIELKKIFNNSLKHNVRDNLSPYQRKLLKILRGLKSVVFALADKNLGPVAVSLARYIKDGLLHLQDASTYIILPEHEAAEEDRQLRVEISEWLSKYRDDLTSEHWAYIRKKLEETADEPFGYFYLLYKLHKSPIKTRPVCSDCASTPHALGQWVNEMLQPIAQSQPAYFKDSFVLKKLLDKIVLKRGKRYGLCTFDAVSMYTKIDPKDCLARISEYLLSPEILNKFSFPARALIKAIAIVLGNNRMRFGDVTVRQLIGIAMGMAAAPPIANIYVGIYEIKHIVKFLDDFLIFYKRFIDDGLLIWEFDEDPVVDAANWHMFQRIVNDCGLTWEFSERLNQIDFMDLTISIVGNRIETNLFEKPMSLHLFIPPHSCHPAACFGSLIHGGVLRIHRLCSRQEDIKFWLTKFYSYLLDRGFQHHKILPVFRRASFNAQEYMLRSDVEHRHRARAKKSFSCRRIAFHLRYHPNDPSSRVLQKLMKDHLFHPKGSIPLNQCTNQSGDLVPIDGMVVAYSRGHNIGNLLSYRKICNRPGPKVSSYL